MDFAICRLGMIALLIAGSSGKQPRHLNNRGVKNIEEKLGGDADREHEKRDGNNRPFFVRAEIGENGAGSRKRTAEKGLHCAHKNDGGEKETNNGDCGIASNDGEGTFENEELADKSIESR